MFTGIIEEMGTVAVMTKQPQSCVLTITAPKILSDVHLGDSVAVNGVCLTVTAFSETGFTADVMHETLNCSSLAALRPGKKVNLERAIERAGTKAGNKGFDCAMGAIELVNLIKAIDA